MDTHPKTDADGPEQPTHTGIAPMGHPAPTNQKNSDYW